jgi:hypothetical protein
MGNPRYVCISPKYHWLFVPHHKWRFLRVLGILLNYLYTFGKGDML